MSSWICALTSPGGALKDTQTSKFSVTVWEDAEDETEKERTKQKELGDEDVSLDSVNSRIKSASDETSSLVESGCLC